MYCSRQISCVLLPNLHKNDKDEIFNTDMDVVSNCG